MAGLEDLIADWELQAPQGARVLLNSRVMPATMNKLDYLAARFYRTKSAIAADMLDAGADELLFELFGEDAQLAIEAIENGQVPEVPGKPKAAKPKKGVK